MRFFSFLSRMPTLRGRFLRLTLIITAVSLLLSMIGTLVILRYGLNKTINSQLDELADGMLAQLSPSVMQTSSSGTLPVLLTLFDDRNLFRVLRVETLEGAVLYASEPHLEIMERFFVKRFEVDEDEDDPDRLLTLWHNGRSWRMGWYNDESVKILLAADLAQIDRSLMRVGWAFLLVLPVAFGTAALASRLLALRATDSISDLARRAGEITVERLNERIEIPAGTREIRDLIDLFNAMVDRLGKSFQMTRRFSADASHELKSPLTVMQGILESHVSGENTSSISTEELDTLLSETHRMRAIIEALLLLSRADEGRLIGQWNRVDLAEVVRDVCDDAGILAQEKGVDLRLDLPDRAVGVSGDEGLLRMAIHNLVSNALRYGDDHGRIWVNVEVDSPKVRVRVGNTGTPIHEHAQEVIFERFSRLDQARQRHSGGLGLGLNLARDIARGHGGDVVLLSSGVLGTVFEMTIDVASGHDTARDNHKTNLNPPKLS